MAARPTPIRSKQIALNLDDATRPEEEQKPPFVAVVGGKELTFKDAAELEWDELAEMDSPHEFVRLTLSEDDQTHLYAQKLEGWKFGQLWDAYQRHYGLKNPGRR
jgi:glycerol-3-phosphate dehydrogenase